MKKISKKYIGFTLLGVALSVSSCKKADFAEANLNPETIYTVTPENQFLAASRQVNNDFEYYYDVYRKMNYWLQYSAPAAGNSLNFNLPGGNFNYRYGNLYGNVGPKLIDAIKIIEKMPETEQAAYTQIKSIAQILLCYYAFYTSDTNGSIAYSEAFQARYDGTLTPKYDTQADLFARLDEQVKTAVATLAASGAAQKSLGANDPFFSGDATKWAKAGNALRLRIASRFMKVDANKLKSIATDVLSNSAQMASVDDSWEFKAGPTYADAGSNWNPANFIATKNVVDFMKAKADPRMKVYYMPNASGNYVGGFASPDAPSKPENAALYAAGLTGFAQIQLRLFTPNAVADGAAGTGSAFFPMITYSEYCFLRADFAARGYTTDNAADWYQKGVYASIDYYDRRAKTRENGTGVGIPNYVGVTQPQKDAYYNAAGVKYDASKAVEQIAIQAYFDFYRNPFEAWSWWKRTGYPSTSSTIFAWEKLIAQGVELVLPRRPSQSYLPTSNLNYENQKAALEEMMTSGYYGTGPGDPFGRVWWDKN